jgi:NAD-dependent SIR2 family protein deacetylase
MVIPLDNIEEALRQSAVTVLLGAGASRSHGVPLTREFLPLVYYLTYFDEYELEKTAFSSGLRETLAKLHDSCLEIAESFSKGTITSLGHRDIDNESIKLIVDSFFEISEYRKEGDQFLKQTSKEVLGNLLENVKLLAPYERIILKEHLEHLMFVLGKNLMRGKPVPKEVMNLLPNVEDLMSYFDINYLVSSITPIRNLFENIEVTKNENSIYHAIMTVLCVTARGDGSPLRREGKDDEEPYFSLEKFAKNRLKTTFVTFNYDTLLENQLEAYGVPFTYGLDIQNRDNSKKFSCSVLKLHGSSNIWQCKNCQNNSLHAVRSLEEYCSLLEEDFSWRIPDIQCCRDSELFPLIVPPTMLKTMNNLSLIRFWIAAEKALEESQTIAFIGYSFPKEDIMARNLIKSAMTKARDLKYIIYINRNPSHLSFIEEILSEKQTKPDILAFTNRRGLAEKCVPNLSRYSSFSVSAFL